jgi:regulator of protease activity HflC (stomatin/prohibitin superfamily)
MFDFGAIATVLVVSVLLTISGIKILKEYERAVIFRAGTFGKGAWSWDYLRYSMG